MINILFLLLIFDCFLTRSLVSPCSFAPLDLAPSLQSLAMKQEMIQTENAKFARKFSTPHTSMYTGVKQSIDQILDPKYQPWGNDGPRKAYYQGY